MYYTIHNDIGNVCVCGYTNIHYNVHVNVHTMCRAVPPCACTSKVIRIIIILLYDDVMDVQYIVGSDLEIT